MFGDPHIRTLDGQEFTFNGHGEYTLIQITDTSTGQIVFNMQGAVNSLIFPDMQFSFKTTDLLLIPNGFALHQKRAIK